jgi:hypothetical protein
MCQELKRSLDQEIKGSGIWNRWNRHEDMRQNIEVMKNYVRSQDSQILWSINYPSNL